MTITNFISTSSTGYDDVLGSGGDSYSSVRTAANGDGVSYGGDYISVGQIYASSSDRYNVQRSYVFFDTSYLGTATITGATLYLYGDYDDSSTNFSITITTGMPTYPHDPPVNGDFYYLNYGTTSGGALSTTSFSITGYNAITLNATGYGWINKTGTTKFCIRSSRDIAGNTPTGHETVDIKGYGVGAGYWPYLAVTYIPGAPTVTTQSVSSISTTSATGNGNITVLNGESCYSRGIVYAASASSTLTMIPLTNPSFETVATPPTGWTSGGTGVAVTNSTTQVKYGTYSGKIVNGATYEGYCQQNPTAATYSSKIVTFSCWAWASSASRVVLDIYDNDGSGYIADESTSHPGDSAWHLLTVTHTCRASLTDFIVRCRINPGSSITAYFDGALVAVSTNGTPIIIPEDGTFNTGAFTEALSSLSENTTYSVIAYATNSGGTSYGSTVTFTTLQAATVTTQAVTSIGPFTATGNGNITAIGNPAPTIRGICYSSVNAVPTTSDSKVEESGTFSTGAYTEALSSLSPEVLYYCRAYVINTVGTSYGGVVTFTTLPSIVYKTISARFKLWLNKDIKSRFKEIVQTYKTINFRLKTVVQTFKNISSRFKVLVEKDIKSRFKLWVEKNIESRMNISIENDILSRFKVALEKDILSRFKNIVIEYKNINYRFTVFVIDIKNINSKFILNILQDINSRFNIVVIFSNTIYARFITFVAVIEDINSKFILWLEQNIDTRFNEIVQTISDIKSRFEHYAYEWEFILSKFNLIATSYKNIYYRFKLVVATLKDLNLKFKVYFEKNLQFKFNLVVQALKLITILYKLFVFTQMLLRMRFSIFSIVTKSLLLKYILHANSIKDTKCRFNRAIGTLPDSLYIRFIDDNHRIKQIDV